MRIANVVVVLIPGISSRCLINVVVLMMFQYSRVVVVLVMFQYSCFVFSCCCDKQRNLYRKIKKKTVFI